MSKPIQIEQVLTANRLSDGLVVFLGPDGEWREGLAEAAIAKSKEVADALEAAGADAEDNNVVVGAYLIGVIENDGRRRAAHIREHLRALGPSVRPDLGKQAEASQASLREVA
ncbi:MAG: DUF2849 domain-containing protein [Hyphomicrobiaceae bacterium]